MKSGFFLYIKLSFTMSILLMMIGIILDFNPRILGISSGIFIINLIFYFAYREDRKTIKKKKLK
jgi:hypothetical protein